LGKEVHMEEDWGGMRMGRGGEKVGTNYHDLIQYAWRKLEIFSGQKYLEGGIREGRVKTPPSDYLY
jgi:protein-disulfide isomerase-like protein with CxxC motif